MKKFHDPWKYSQIPVRFVNTKWKYGTTQAFAEISFAFRTTVSA